MMDQDKSQSRFTHPDPSQTLIASLRRSGYDFKDSTTYLKILRDGRAEGLVIEARRFLLRLGIKRFGTPDAIVLAAIEGIYDVYRLEALGERLLVADLSDWDDLLKPV